MTIGDLLSLLEERASLELRLESLDREYWKSKDDETKDRIRCEIENTRELILNIINTKIDGTKP